MDVPTHFVSPGFVYVKTVKPLAGGPQRGEGLADPAVLCFLQITGQDSLLVLQLLHEDTQMYDCKYCIVQLILLCFY